MQGAIVTWFDTKLSFHILEKKAVPYIIFNATQKYLKYYTSEIFDFTA